MTALSLASSKATPKAVNGAVLFVSSPSIMKKTRVSTCEFGELRPSARCLDL